MTSRGLTTHGEVRLGWQWRSSGWSSATELSVRLKLPVRSPYTDRPIRPQAWTCRGPVPRFQCSPFARSFPPFAHPRVSFAHPRVSFARPHLSLAHPHLSLAHPYASFPHLHLSLPHPRASLPHALYGLTNHRHSGRSCGTRSATPPRLVTSHKRDDSGDPTPVCPAEPSDAPNRRGPVVPRWRRLPPNPPRLAGRLEAVDGPRRPARAGRGTRGRHAWLPARDEGRRLSRSGTRRLNLTPAGSSR